MWREFWSLALGNPDFASILDSRIGEILINMQELLTESRLLKKRHDELAAYSRFFHLCVEQRSSHHSTRALNRASESTLLLREVEGAGGCSLWQLNLE
jgi:hypothetical protein